ncbi:MAG: hypothetical protein SGJ13_07080 [Actinomycetota bacterium]|nr:hypothetical protein [Actinomycetota bacterium]
MSEVEVALVFTADPWVEELHRHLSDHGGARVRQLVVEAGVALEESYDVLVVSHRWPALTHALVADLRATGRSVLGVYDREEPASRDHLQAVDVDRMLTSDAGPGEFVEMLQRMRSRRDVGTGPEPEAVTARGLVVAVGGAPGVGRTEVAVQLALTMSAPLVDADDVAPAVAQRLGLSIEPNLRTAIDAVEHGRGTLAASITTDSGTGLRVISGLPNPRAWAQVRPGEVVRILDRLVNEEDCVVVDGIGSLEDVGGPTRSRNAVARALVLEANVLVAVCDAGPVGVARLLTWAMDVRSLAPDTPLVVAVNRAPTARFRRGELYDEITRTLPVIDVVFVPSDRKVTEAAWNGTSVARGGFVRGVTHVGEVVRGAPRVQAAVEAVREAS